MNEKTSFEIPQSMRDLAEQSVEQAKDAYDRWIEANQKAQTMLSQSSEAMTAGTKDIQAKVAEHAEANVQAGFDLAQKLVKAKDLQEALEIQNTFARQQMETYSRQAQELTQLMQGMAKKAQPKQD